MTTQERPRILLVEDDQLSREALAYILEVEGYFVTTAEDGKVALDHLHHIPALSAVLLDLGLPTISGYDFIRAQKRDPETADIPTIVITAMFEPSVPEAAAVLQKPLDLPRLKNILRKVARRSVPERKWESDLVAIMVRLRSTEQSCREVCESTHQIVRQTRQFLSDYKLRRSGLN